MIVGSVPPSLSVVSTHPTSLCLLCRTGIVRYCRQSGERLGEFFLRTTKGGTDPSITNIYSLFYSYSVPKRGTVGGFESGSYNRDFKYMYLAAFLALYLNLKTNSVTRIVILFLCGFLAMRFCSFTRFCFLFLTNQTLSVL